MQRGKRTLGQTFQRGEAGYETARAETMWNNRLPPRYPDVIVQANGTGDVLAAVRMARRENLRIGVRSGGHSWSGDHVRDGGLLLDISRLDEVRIDNNARRATVGPGRAGHELADRQSRSSSAAGWLMRPARPKPRRCSCIVRKKCRTWPPSCQACAPSWAKAVKERFPVF
jgi:hypothetical protein